MNRGIGLFFSFILDHESYSAFLKYISKTVIFLSDLQEKMELLNDKFNNGAKMKERQNKRMQESSRIKNIYITFFQNE